ncbi:MafI family immunity protein [Microlunatus soli]|uniref:Uncharacterized protein n=1 Tax=Microlunatus soli TaxID=630515 RepID=A0A1H1XCB0_9ACTN|nr:MafI family immunity protein [Microlunatus soli]SDT06917.1 hypothetical protein SAMN04489812_4022 [Microlunatus soli]
MVELSELERRIIQAAERNADCLTDSERSKIRDLVMHNESGVAYEMLCEQLYERECQISRANLDDLRELGESLGISYGTIPLWEAELRDREQSQ